MRQRRFRIEPEGLPDLPGMMLATAEALKRLGGSASIEELDEAVMELEGVTEAEQSIMMANNERRAKVNYYLAWARTYLKRGGALEKSGRGIWALTESGAALSERTHTKAIYDQVQAEEREKARQKRRSREDLGKLEIVVASVDDGPIDEEDWKTALLDVLSVMPPDAFERLS